jgi:tetratricopeptide (TPR) repeat protein
MTAPARIKGWMDPAGETVARGTQARRRALYPVESLLETARRDLGPALVGSVLPFALVLYLALRGGGYDSIVYGEVGIAVWWLLLLGALVGILPATRIPRAGWVALALLAAFAAWTALGITWSESAERSAAEAGRVAAYLGVFALALAAQGRDGLRRTVNAFAAAIALVGVLALLSRLHPAWFPADDAARLLPRELGSRLNYPLNYWNGLAALIVMGIPLLLGIAVRAQHLVTRALAAATLPAMVLTIFYTFSRGGVLVLGVALLGFIALYPRRLAALPTLLVAGAGSAILIAGGTQRDALQERVLSDAAHVQGDEMLAMALVVCAGVGLVQVAIALSAQYGLGPRPKVTRRRHAALAVGAACTAVVIGLVAGLPGEVADRWTETDESVGNALGSERLQSVSTQSRRMYWEAALDANATAPLVGIGPGAYEYWWARNSVPGVPFARDAHSLYVETLAELGIIGLVLLLLAMGAVLAACMRRALGARPERRLVLAPATASCVAFVAFAGIDWLWELAVLPVTFLLLVAAIIGPEAMSGAASGADRALEPRPPHSPRGRAATRIGLGALAVLALIAITLPHASTVLVRNSGEQLRSGELDSALDSAEMAETVEPYAATPKLEQALVLERSGKLAAAATAASDATRSEPTNWRTWLVLAGIEARRERAASAIDAYREAHRLNSRSSVFAQMPPARFASTVDQ